MQLDSAVGIYEEEEREREVMTTKFLPTTRPEEEENVHICLQLMIRGLPLYSLLSLLSVPPLLSALQLPLARSETLNVGGI